MNNISINLNDFIRSLTNEALTKIYSDVPIAEGFNHYLRQVRLTKANGTFENNKSHATTLIMFLESLKVFNFNEINNQTISNLIELMRGRNNRNRTINMRIQLLIKAHKHLANEQMIGKFGFDFKQLKEQEVKINVTDNIDIKRMLEYSKLLDEQSQLIVLILVGCGTRRTETSIIQLNNIDYKENQIALVDTKNHKVRYIYITDEMIALCKKVSAGNLTYLFETSENKHIRAQSISLLMNRIRRALKIKYLSPHKLRHAYATNLIRQGADIETVRRLMGHASIEITKRYFDLTNEELRASALKFNPINLLSK